MEPTALGDFRTTRAHGILKKIPKKIYFLRTPCAYVFTYTSWVYMPLTSFAKDSNKSLHLTDYGLSRAAHLLRIRVEWNVHNLNYNPLTTVCIMRCFRFILIMHHFHNWLSILMIIDIKIFWGVFFVRQTCWFFNKNLKNMVVLIKKVKFFGKYVW